MLSGLWRSDEEFLCREGSYLRGLLRRVGVLLRGPENVKSESVNLEEVELGEVGLGMWGGTCCFRFVR